MRDSSVTNCESRERFLELLAQHEAQLLGFLCATTRSFQDAEDLFQQTVLAMWQKFGEFEPGSNFVAWGCKIGRYKAMNLYARRRESLLDDDVLDLLVTTQAAEEPEVRLARRRALSACVGKLDEDDRGLIQSAYASSQSIKSLAETAGRSTGGVYNSLARIRKTLFRCIQVTLAKEGHA